MAKTYNVYIAETMYELVYPTSGTQRRYLHFDKMSESQVEYLKAIANEGEMAIAYMANEEDDYGRS